MASIVVGDALNGLVTIEATDGNRAEQVTKARVTADKCADTLPQIIQCLAVLVARLDKAAPQFQPRLQDRLHAGPEFEQAVGIQGFWSTLGQQCGAITQPIGADNLQCLLVPENQLQVVTVVAVEIPRPAGALADGAEGQFPQPPQFAHHTGGLIPAYQQNGLAVAGATQ